MYVSMYVCMHMYLCMYVCMHIGFERMVTKNHLNTYIRNTYIPVYRPSHIMNDHIGLERMVTEQHHIISLERVSAAPWLAPYIDRDAQYCPPF